MKKFFEEIVRENSGRAVRRETPLDYEQARAKWMRVVASCCPQVGGFLYGQLVQPAVAAGRAEPVGVKAEAGRGQKGAGRGAAGSGGATRTLAGYNGLAVCFYYNSKDGCQRQAQGPMACQEGNNVYAHVCNHFFKPNGNQPGRHCLAMHSRFGNH
jgi:hypothetical protein